MKRFKRFISLVMSVLIMLSCYSVITASAEYVEKRVIISESFDVDCKKWTMRSGKKISVSDGRLEILTDNLTETVALHGERVTVGNFVISVRVELDAKFAGIIFGDNGNSNNYLFQIGEGVAALYVRKNSTSYQKLCETSVAVQAGNTYNFGICIVENKVVAYIDDMEVLTYGKLEYTAGNVGVRCYSGTVYADSFQVVLLADTELPYYGEISDNTTKMVFEKRVAELPQEHKVRQEIPPYTAEHVYYVAKDGQNNADGSINSPFATLERAILECSKKSSNERSVIYIRGGNYTVDSPIYVDVSNVYIAEYPNEDVSFTSAIEIGEECFASPTKEIKQRLRPEIAERIVCVRFTDFNVFPSETGRASGMVSTENGIMHLSRWPNFETVKTGRVLDEGPEISFGDIDDGRGFTFKYFDDRIEHWQNISDVWMYGGFSREWAKQNIRIRAIDIQQKTLNTYDASYYGASAGMDYYYYNILEELDMPDEYYIDYAENKLYLYNPKGTVYFSEAKSQPLFEISPNTNNVVISGIGFRNTSLGVLVDGINNTVQGCNFENISSIPASLKGEKNHIINCRFVNCGSIDVSGGDRVNLIPAGNAVTNCVVLSSKEITLTGVGNVINHNYIANSDASGIVINSANECVVEYNELTDLVKGSDDAGAIYCGGDITKRGIHIRNNYIHDIGNAEENITPHAIYFDDVNSDNFAYGNIIANVDVPIMINGGRELAVVNNIIYSDNTSYSPAINIDSLVVRDGLNSEGFNYWEVDGPSKVYKNYDTYNFDRSYWFKRYPRYEGYFEDEPRFPKYNYIANNLCVNYSRIDVIDEASETITLSDNIFTGENPGFANVTAKDYSISDVSGIRAEIPEFYAPDFKRMGTLYKNTISQGRLYFPQNGENVINPLETEFVWQKNVSASEYEVIVSKNSDLSAPIICKTSKQNYINLVLEEFNTDYYWTVRAKNSALSFGDVQLQYPVFKFRTMPESVKLRLDVRAVQDLCDRLVTKGYDVQALESIKDKAASAENLIDSGDLVTAGFRIAEISEGLKEVAENVTILDVDFADEKVGTDVLGGLTSGDNSVGTIGGERVLIMQDNSASDYTVAQLDADFEGGTVRFKTRVKLAQRSGELNIKFRLQDGTDPIVVQFASDGKVFGERYYADIWYNVDVSVDFNTGQCNVYINDTLYHAAKFEKNLVFRSIVFTTGFGKEHTGVYYVSDVMIAEKKYVSLYNSFNTSVKNSINQFIYADVGINPESSAWCSPAIFGGNKRLYNLTDGVLDGLLITSDEEISSKNISLRPGSSIDTAATGKVFLWKSLSSLAPLAQSRDFSKED